ncbi:hypothetical protein [Paenibacillus larvae]|uniref:Uncharacterized protein n=1 Tax=Paenibacillus larvae subsp. larvae TaxID=147375 RepID=A0A2L1U7F4_9BACL|nr:hypothetical protein [Paenibacillus larvae]AVF28852.1 hypothetical protein ERICIII_04849 [Paenibacillus larvae subsp. larvae]MDR5608748.1 hypothetical protein [Paenibacillus larvae]
MFYQYHEIAGSEKPIFETKPAGVLLYDEITLYEPLYVKVRREG